MTAPGGRVEPIVRTLKRAASRDDLTAKVYGRLFALHPDTEAQFVRDKDGAVRGEMLAKVFEIILDTAEGHAWAPRMIQCEVVTHEGYGVSPEIFPAFFDIVAEEVEAACKADWSATEAGCWSDLLAKLNWYATHSDQRLAASVG